MLPFFARTLAESFPNLILVPRKKNIFSTYGCVVDEVCPDKEFNATIALDELEGEKEITMEFVIDYSEDDIDDNLN